MGFRTGAYAKVWEVSPMSDTGTKLRISISHKNKDTNEYVQDFSGYTLCVGTAAAGRAARLKKGDRIKLGDCDVTTKYDAARQTTYTNFKIFSFDSVESDGGASPSADPQPEVDSGEVDDSQPRLPF